MPSLQLPPQLFFSKWQYRPKADEVQTEVPQVHDFALADIPFVMGHLAYEQVFADARHTRPLGMEQISVPHRHAAMFGTPPFVLAHNGPRKHKHVVLETPHTFILVVCVFLRICFLSLESQHPGGRVIDA